MYRGVWTGASFWHVVHIFLGVHGSKLIVQNVSSCRSVGLQIAISIQKRGYTHIVLFPTFHIGKKSLGVLFEVSADDI